MPYRQKRRAPHHDAGRRPAKRQHHQHGGPHLPGKLLRELQPDGTQGKRPSRKGPSRPAPSKSRFTELLERDAITGSDHTAAIAAEDALQAQLAKKLGIKAAARPPPQKAPPPAAQQFTEDDHEDDVPEASSDDAHDEGGSDFDWQSDMEDMLGGDSDEDEELQGMHGGSMSRAFDSDSEDAHADDDDDEDDDDDGDEDYDEDDHKGILTKHKHAADPHSKEAPQPYRPPALRAASGTDEATSRRVRGLLNRLAESTLSWVVSQLEELHRDRRQAVEMHVIEQLVEAVSEGPRATDAFAAVSACCVAALAAKTRSQALAARFLERLAHTLEQAKLQGRSVASVNLVNVVAHVYACGLIGPEVLYSLLDTLRSRFTENDVALIAAVLRACGARLRADDPVAMKAMVVSVHARAAEAAKASPLSTRTEAMLGLVLDVKNNRAKQGSTATALSQSAARWVAGCGVLDVQLRNLSWPLLLEDNKTGRWWQGHLQPLHGPASAGTATTGDLLPEDGADAERLRVLATRLRLNTDARKTVFYAVMGSSDVADATERLLRLSLKGEQQREIIRVPVTCCLQERTWNPFYAHLLLHLVASSRAHGVTLRYCLWDQIKGLQQERGPSLGPRQAVNLARLLATLTARGGVPLLTLRVVEWGSPMGELATLTWQTWSKHLCAEADAQGLTDVAARAVATKGAGDVCRGMASFLRVHVVPWLSDAALAAKAALLAKLLHKGAAVAVA